MRLLPLLSLSVVSQPRSKKLNVELPGAPICTPRVLHPSRQNHIPCVWWEGRAGAALGTLGKGSCCPSPPSPRDD